MTEAKKLAAEIEMAGGRLVRVRGDHFIYKLPNGRVVSLPMFGHNREASDGVEAKVRRELRRLKEDRR